MMFPWNPTTSDPYWQTYTIYIHLGWGVSADRRARVEAIAQHLLDSSYDIVFLQVSVSVAVIHLLPYVQEVVTQFIL